MNSKLIECGRRAAPLAAALALGSCAHFQKPAWHCISQVEEGGITAATFRTLNRAGRQIRVRSEWVRPYTRNPRTLFRGEWRGTVSDVDLSTGQIKMELNVSTDRVVQLELRTGAVTRPASNSRLIGRAGAHPPSLSLKWPMLRELIATQEKLFLVRWTQRGR